jgi:hypothetical protein
MIKSKNARRKMLITGIACAQYHFNKQFAKIIALYDLQYDDAADIISAYQVLNWVNANNAANPKPTAVNAVRSATISALQQNGK